MWALRTTVPPGKPLSCAWKRTLPLPVIAPVVSRGTVKVMVAVPRALGSAFVIGGVSFAALSCTVKVIGPWLFDGVVGLSLPHAVTSVTNATAASLLIGPLLLCILGPRTRNLGTGYDDPFV